jgi:carbamoyltransferase
LYAGQGIEWDKLSVKRILHDQIGQRAWQDVRYYHSYNHHLSHAAGGFQTSPYDRATVVVIDAIGEWDTISIWGAEYDRTGRARYKRLWGQRYPHSLGLFYSAITKRVGLHPLDEEYITMGMSAYGDDHYNRVMEAVLIRDPYEIEFGQNLHAGVSDDFMGGLSEVDIAASAQRLLTRLIGNVMRRARDFGWSTNLVYQGGVALNCLANRRLGKYFENIWIMPNPGDAGSSLGAAALAYGKRLHWHNAYLGHNIPGPYPVDNVVRSLLDTGIVGVANGRAEFGPRALGNRSLLADPRGAEIKDRVNEIKRRQKFRPFAPVILAELADDYFDIEPGWHTHNYMQSVAHCRQPDVYPAICHVDGTSRVQTVEADGSGIRQLLEAWYARTGCPMLLNTSLNIRGEPMVNDRAEADRFEYEYGVKVYS